MRGTQVNLLHKLLVDINLENVTRMHSFKEH